jgi:putative membrane protein
MSFVEILPSLNATLNGLSAICIFIAWRSIRARRPDLHWKFMVAAISFSAVFLGFYLTRVALSGTHVYPVADWTKPVYLTILITHIILAATVPFLVGRSVWLASKKRFEAHRRIVRFALPIWGYVSVTGVVVYLMLYHLAPARM